MTGSMPEGPIETALGLDTVAVPVSPPSFIDFFNDEHARLFRALYLVTANRQEAEEAMQDAFVRIWERWDEVSRMKSPTGYLFKTALNVSRMRYRSASRAARRVMRGSAQVDQFIEVDVREEVRTALAGLTPRQRAALVLTDMLGYSSKEAADVLGVRDSTVRVLASHARASLRATMEDPRA